MNVGDVREALLRIKKSDVSVEGGWLIHHAPFAAVLISEISHLYEDGLEKTVIVTDKNSFDFYATGEEILGLILVHQGARPPSSLLRKELGK